VECLAQGRAESLVILNGEGIALLEYHRAVDHVVDDPSSLNHCSPIRESDVDEKPGLNDVLGETAGLEIYVKLIVSISLGQRLARSHSA
jgi:hypothetical protein